VVVPDKENTMRIINPVFIFIICLSCSQNSIKSTDLWEGINNDTIRVYVRYEVPEENSEVKEEKDFDVKVDALLMEEAKKRAYMIIAGYEYYNKKESGRDIVRPDQVDFEKGRVIVRKCDDAFCHAIVDFTIRNN
jgi:hypothetical protein